MDTVSKDSVGTEPIRCMKHMGLRSAFSLIEMLAVLAIIAVLAVLVLGIDNRNEGFYLGNGQRIASSVFQAARHVATSRGAKTRVIVYRGGGPAGNDASNDASKQLRFIGIVFEDTSTAPSTWKPANAGTYLPENVYFVPSDTPLNSFVSAVDVTLLRSQLDNNAAIPTGSFSFPSVGANPDSWYYFEFDQQGFSKTPGANFVLAAGEKIAPAGNNVTYSIELNNPNAVVGFQVRKMGGLIPFEHNASAVSAGDDSDSGGDNNGP